MSKAVLRNHKKTSSRLRSRKIARKHLPIHQAILATFRHLFHPHSGNNHRAKILHPHALWYLTGVLIVILLLARLASATLISQGGAFRNPMVLGYSSSISPELVLDSTNQERTRMGLAPLVINRQLSQAATAKAQHMFQNQYWSHTAPDGTQPWDFMKSYSYRVAGENLARDFQTTDTMVRAWMDSPTHRANIVNGVFQETGIAVVNGTLQGFETTLVVQMFGAPKTSVAQIPTQAAASQPVEAAKAPTPAVQGTSEIISEDPGEVQLADSVPVPEKQPAEATLEKSGALARISSTPLLQSLTPPNYSPLDITKALVLAIVLLVVVTLAYDGLVAAHMQLDRAVGFNFGHIMVFTAVAYLVIMFRSGLVL